MKITKWNRVLSMAIVVVLCLSMIHIPVAGAMDNGSDVQEPEQTIETTPTDEPTEIDPDPGDNTQDETVVEEEESTTAEQPDPDPETPAEEDGAPSDTQEGDTPEQIPDDVEENSAPSDQQEGDTPAQSADNAVKKNASAAPAEKPTQAATPKKKSAELAATGDDELLELSASSPNVSRSNLISVFGDNALSGAYYGIAPATATSTDDIVYVTLTSPYKNVSPGTYIAYKTTAATGSLLNRKPDWTQASSMNVTVKLYYTATFSVSGCDDGAIKLNGEAVSGSKRLYTDEEYTVTVENVEGYTYTLTGAAEGDAFTPSGNMTISAVYEEILNAFATIELVVGEGGEAEITSDGALVNDTIAEGKTFKVTAKPAMLHELDAITVTKNGEAVEATEGEYGPVADGEAYKVTVTFTAVDPEDGASIERNINSATVNKNDVAGLFGGGILSSGHYGIAPADDPDNIFYFSLLNTLANYSVTAGTYIAYMTTESTGGALSPTPTWSAGTAVYLNVRTYTDVNFTVTGCEDGEIKLNGEAVTGSQKLYTDTQYTVTAKAVTDYEYEITGAEDGVAFTPDADTPATITASYSKDEYATFTLTVGEGGQATVNSLGAEVTEKIMAGETFTVTATPDMLYELDAITVTKNGAAVEPTEGAYGPVADGEVYLISVTFKSSDTSNDIQIERDVKSATINRSDITGFFGDSALSLSTYSIAPADDPTDTTTIILNTYPVPAGRYIVYKGSTSNPTAAYYLTVRTYASVDFTVSGCEDGEIKLNGEAVTGSQKLYTDTQYTVTATAVDDYEYVITGAEDGVAFTPDADTPATITASYSKDEYATFTLTVGEGGQATVNSLGAEVTEKIMAGETFTVTATPDMLYELDAITVTKNGAAVEPTEGAYGPVADGEVYLISVTFKSSDTSNDIQIERDVKSATINRSDITGFFGDSALSLSTYSIAPADDPTDTTTIILNTYPVPAGRYIVYKGSTSNPTAAYYLTVRTYASVNFTVTGCEDGEIYLNGTAVTGSQKLYTDTQYTVTAKDVNEYVYSISGADDGIPFTPDADTPDTISAVYIQNTFATITVSSNEGGEVAVTSGGEAVVDKVPAGNTFKVTATPESDNNYFVDSVIVTKNGTEITADANGEYGPVADGEAYAVTVTFSQATLTLADCDVNIVDIKNGDFVAVESAIINSATIVPAQLADDAEVKVEFVSGSLLSIEYYSALDYTSLLTHAFGTSTLGGTLQEGNTEKVRVTYTIPSLDITLQATATATVTDQRIPTTINSTNIIITYGDDLKAAVIEAISVNGSDGKSVEFTADDITIDPESLDISLGTLLSNQEVTVSYGGNDTYAASKGTIGVYVRQADSSIDVKSETITYGEEPALQINTDPADLDYIRIIGGIDGDAAGFISIDIPESTKERLQIKIGGVVVLDIYQLLVDQIGDGVTLNGFKDIVDNLISTVQNPLISAALSAAGINIESFQGVFDFISGLPGLDVNAKITLGNPPKNAGLYLVGAVSTDLNYRLAGDVGYLTILPKTSTEEESVTLKFKNEIPGRLNVMTYEEAQEFEFGGDMYINDELADSSHVRALYIGTTYNGNLSVESGEPIREPGVYTETIYALGGNYLPAPISRIYTIGRMPTTIAMDDATFTYDGKGHSLTAYAEDGHDLGDNVTYLYSGTGYLSYAAPVNVGTYTVIATYAGDASYQAATARATLKITRAEAVIKATCNETVTYGDISRFNHTAANLGYEVTGTFGNDVLGIIEPYVRNPGNLPHIGDYSVGIIFVQTNNNYHVTIENASFKVVPREMVITIANKEKYYGDSDPRLTYSIDNAPAFGNLNVKLSRQAGENVGTYPISATYTESEDYTVTVVGEGTEDPTGTFTIKPMPVIVKVASTGKEVGDDDPGFVFTVTDVHGRSLNPNRIGLSIKREDGEGIGEYAISASVSNTNYVLDEDKSSFGTFTITTKKVIVRVRSLTKVYGDDDPAFVYTITDKNGRALDPQTVGFSIQREPGDDVGVYAITYSIGSKQYTLDKERSTTGTLTILPRYVIVKLKSQSKLYSDPDPAYDYTITDERGNPLDAETVGLSITRRAGENIGVYPISYRLTNDNYNLDILRSTTGTLTIKPMPITLKIESAEKPFGTRDPAVVYTITDANGKPLTASDVGLFIVRQAGERLGEYPYAAAINNENYVFDKEKSELGKLTIVPYSIIVKIESQTKTYGDPDPEFKYTVTNEKGMPLDPRWVGLSVTREPGEDVGDYTISASTKYRVFKINTEKSENGTLTILPKKVIVTVTPASKTYGQDDPAFEYTVTDQDGNPIDPKEIGLTVSRAPGDNVGEYPISASVSNNNYAIDTEGSSLGNFVINKADAVVNVSCKDSVVYGEMTADDLSAADISYTISGVKDGDELGTVSTMITNPENLPHVGDYQVSASVADPNGNYNITVVPATVKVKPRSATIIVDSKVKYFGDKDPELTYTVSGLLDGDTLNVSLIRETGENVGVYAIAALYDDNPDYSVTVGDSGSLAPTGADQKQEPSGATLTIQPKSITVTLKPAGKKYGDPDPTFEYTVTDQDGNPIDPAGVGVVISRAKGEDVGEYPVTITVNSGNYTINKETSNPGKFVIEPKKIIVSVEPATKQVGEEDPDYQYTVTDENGNPIDPASVGIKFTREPGEKPGKYRVTMTTSANFEIDMDQSSSPFFLTITDVEPTEAPTPAEPDDSTATPDSATVINNVVAPKTGYLAAGFAVLAVLAASMFVVLVLRKRRENDK